MSKTKKPQRNCLNKGRLPSDDPIYTGGYIMLSPIQGKVQKLDGEEEHLRNDDDGDKSTEE